MMYVMSLIRVTDSFITVTLHNGDYMNIYFTKRYYPTKVNKHINTCSDVFPADQAIIQTQSRTTNYPLAPHVKDYKMISALEFMEKFITTDEKVAAWFRTNIYDLITKQINFGTLIYESLTNFQPISKLLNKKKLSKYKKDLYVGMYAYVLIIEAVVFKLCHKCNDSNICIDIKDNTFFRGLNGRPIITDFSETKQISHVTMADINILFESKQYSDIIIALHQNEINSCKSHIYIIEQPTSEFNANVDYLIELRKNMLKRPNKYI